MANEFKTHRVVKATYDFDTLGGGVANAVGLNTFVPNGALITRVFTVANTAFTSGGNATVAINVGSVEVNAATAFDDAAYVAGDQHYGATGALGVLAADSEINIDIAVAALTAGAYDVFVEYLY